MDEVSQYQSYATILEACLGRMNQLHTDWNNGILPDDLYHRKIKRLGMAKKRKSTSWLTKSLAEFKKVRRQSDSKQILFT